jgi:sugar/nucleoside kinase (ribokinase family)
MTTGRLIQLSGIIVDLIYWVDAVPAAGSEAVVRRHALVAGGGFNALAAARRAGIAADYAGSIGTGAFARIVEDALVTEGIGILSTRKAGMDQGCCTVLIDREGERSFIAAEGADGVVTDADLARIAPGPRDWMLLSGYALGYEGSRLAFGRWLGREMPLVFDPGPLVSSIDPEILKAAMVSARWISANRSEAEVLTGLGDAGGAARRLAQGRPGGGAVVRDGANGCHVATGNLVHHLPGFAVAAVDTNGAGDAHIGAFIAGLALGDDPVTAARIANATAALSTLKEGPSTAPTREAALSALLAAEMIP